MVEIGEDEIMILLYKFYGTDSGVLFGLQASEKPIVKVIVKAILNIIKESEEGEV